MALLAFPLRGPNSVVYAQLYDNSRWLQLVSQFRADNFALYSLTSQPQLTISLQAGLSVLKTPQCYMVCRPPVLCAHPFSSFPTWIVPPPPLAPKQEPELPCMQ